MGSDLADVVPDLPTVVTGWRWWRIIEAEDQPRLVGPVLSVPWPPRAEMIATCRTCPSQHVPGPWCDCGLHAVIDLADAAATPNRGEVLGCVALWGQVVQGTSGWRAARAYPLVLFTEPRVDAPTRDRLAALYGVSVHAAPAALTELIRLGGPRMRTAANQLRDRAASGGPPAPKNERTELASELREQMRQLTPLTRARSRRRNMRYAAGLLWVVPVLGSTLAATVLPLARALPPPWSWLLITLLVLVDVPIMLAAVWIGTFLARTYVVTPDHRLARAPVLMAFALLAAFVVLPPIGLLGGLLTGAPYWTSGLCAIPLGLAWLGLTGEPRQTAVRSDRGSCP